MPRPYRGADGSLKPTRRWFASAVTATGSRQITAREPVELHDAEDGDFAYSHPEQFAVGDLDLDDGHELILISLYGVWTGWP